MIWFDNRELLASFKALFSRCLQIPEQALKRVIICHGVAPAGEIANVPAAGESPIPAGTSRQRSSWQGADCRRGIAAHSRPNCEIVYGCGMLATRRANTGTTLVVCLRLARRFAGTPKAPHLKGLYMNRSAVTEHFRDALHHLGGIVAHSDDCVGTRFCGVSDHAIEGVLAGFLTEF